MLSKAVAQELGDGDGVEQPALGQYRTHGERVEAPQRAKMMMHVQHMRQAAGIGEQHGPVNGRHHEGDTGTAHRAEDDEEQREQCLHHAPECSHMALLQRHPEFEADAERDVEDKRYGGDEEWRLRQVSGGEVQNCQAAEQQGGRQHRAAVESGGDIGAVLFRLPGGEAARDKGDEGAAEAQRKQVGEPGQRGGGTPDTETGKAEGVQSDRQGDERAEQLRHALRHPGGGGGDEAETAGLRHECD